MNPQNRKAVSPVIATVILVAVAITVSVGVSYWMGGISSQYTQFEKVEIKTGYGETDAGTATTGWQITLTIKNSGSATATITNVFVNDVPVDTYDATAISETGGETTTDVEVAGRTLTAGDETTVHVWIAAGGTSTLSSGTTVNIKLHSAGGMDYIKLIRLP